MRYVPVEEARKKLGHLIREAAAGDPVVIGRHGTQRAVLLSDAEYERLKQMEKAAAHARFVAALESISDAVREAGVGPEVVEQAIREVRSDARAARERVQDQSGHQ